MSALGEDMEGAAAAAVAPDHGDDVEIPWSADELVAVAEGFMRRSVAGDLDALVAPFEVPKYILAHPQLSVRFHPDRSADDIREVWLNEVQHAFDVLLPESQRALIRLDEALKMNENIRHPRYRHVTPSVHAKVSVRTFSPLVLSSYNTVDNESEAADIDEKMEKQAYREYNDKREKNVLFDRDLNNRQTNVALKNIKHSFVVDLGVPELEAAGFAMDLLTLEGMAERRRALVGKVHSLFEDEKLTDTFLNALLPGVATRECEHTMYAPIEVAPDSVTLAARVLSVSDRPAEVPDGPGEFVPTPYTPSNNQISNSSSSAIQASSTYQPPPGARNHKRSIIQTLTKEQKKAKREAINAPVKRQKMSYKTDGAPKTSVPIPDNLDVITRAFPDWQLATHQMKRRQRNRFRTLYDLSLLPQGVFSGMEGQCWGHIDPSPKKPKEYQLKWNSRSIYRRAGTTGWLRICTYYPECIKFRTGATREYCRQHYNAHYDNGNSDEDCMGAILECPNGYEV